MEATGQPLSMRSRTLSEPHKDIKKAIFPAHARREGCAGKTFAIEVIAPLNQRQRRQERLKCPTVFDMDLNPAAGLFLEFGEWARSGRRWKVTPEAVAGFKALTRQSDSRRERRSFQTVWLSRPSDKFVPSQGILRGVCDRGFDRWHVGRRKNPRQFRILKIHPAFPSLHSDLLQIGADIKTQFSHKAISPMVQSMAHGNKDKALRRTRSSSPGRAFKFSIDQVRAV